MAKYRNWAGQVEAVATAERELNLALGFHVQGVHLVQLTFDHDGDGPTVEFRCHRYLRLEQLQLVIVHMQQLNTLLEFLRELSQEQRARPPA